MRDENEVQAMCDLAATAAGKPSACFGMTYEEGVRNALEWVIDEDIPDEEAPITT